MKCAQKTGLLRKLYAAMDIKEYEKHSIDVATRSLCKQICVKFINLTFIVIISAFPAGWPLIM